MACALFAAPHTLAGEDPPPIIVNGDLVNHPVQQHEEVCEHPYCYCVTTARHLGVDIPMGTNAWDFVSNTTTPHVGDLILFSYEDTDHVSVIMGTLAQGWWVGEGNFKRGEYTERFIAFDDPFIRGFWSDK